MGIMITLARYWSAAQSNEMDCIRLVVWEVLPDPPRISAR